jgi:hypothetical protein
MIYTAILFRLFYTVWNNWLLWGKIINWQVFENKALRKTFGSKTDEDLVCYVTSKSPQLTCTTGIRPVPRLLSALQGNARLQCFVFVFRDRESQESYIKHWRPGTVPTGSVRIPSLAQGRWERNTKPFDHVSHVNKIRFIVILIHFRKELLTVRELLPAEQTCKSFISAQNISTFAVVHCK